MKRLGLWLPAIAIFCLALFVRILYNNTVAQHYYPLHDSLFYQTIGLNTIKEHCFCLHPYISTVYRTLKLFSEKGILERHDFGHKRGRYEEASGPHHDHLIDVESGRVIEFRNESIEALQERIARELGFRLVGHRLELYGVRVKVAKK